MRHIVAPPRPVDRFGTGADAAIVGSVSGSGPGHFARSRRAGARVLASLALLGWGCGAPDRIAEPDATGGDTAESTGAPPVAEPGDSSGTPEAEGGSHDADGVPTTADPDGTTTGSTGAPVEPEPEPPYPIVLAHGFFGFEDFAGVDFVGYFHNVRERLESEGELFVFTPAVDPFNDSTVRGMQLLAEVEAIVEETGAGKVNLVGHSQGGLDARVVASLRPDLVASVTTIATPHHGTPVADIALGLSGSDDAAALVDALVQIVGAGLWEEIDGDTSLAASMQQLSTPGLEAFNADYPDAEGVLYLSIAARSAYHDGGDDCVSEDAPAFITEFVRDRDAIEPLLAVPQAILAGSVIEPIANDGLVRAIDARWGTFLGCVPADHFDEIGQLFGDIPGLTNAWRHEDFYVALVQSLRDRGL
jgi:triacylglycerol lipase